MKESLPTPTGSKQPDELSESEMREVFSILRESEEEKNSKPAEIEKIKARLKELDKAESEGKLSAYYNHAGYDKDYPEEGNYHDMAEKERIELEERIHELEGGKKIKKEVDEPETLPDENAIDQVPKEAATVETEPGTVVEGKETKPQEKGKENEASDMEKQKKVEACKSFDELFAVLKEIGDVKGSQETYTPEVLENLIKEVVSGEKTINYITRSLNLRETVRRLWRESLSEKEAPKKPEDPKPDEPKPEGDGKDKEPVISPTIPEGEKPEEKEILEKGKEMEDMMINLDAMRMRYMIENKKYMEGRKTQGLIGGLWQKLRGIKPQETQELPKELIEAKENLRLAKVALGNKMMKDEKERLEGLNTTPEELAQALVAYKARDVFEKVITDEHELLEKFRQETWPPKERSVFFKALQWYGKQNRVTKLAIGTMVAAGGAAVGGMSAPATALFAGSYLVRGAIATGAGLLAGKGFETFVKDKSGANFSDAVEVMRKSFGNDQIDVEKVENYFREASETKEKERNKYNLCKNLIIGATAIWANIGLSSLEAYLTKPTFTPAQGAPKAPTPPIPSAPGASFSHVVGAKDNMWTILRADMSQNVPGFNALTKAAQNSAIDQHWQKLLHTSTSDLKAAGILSGDPHILRTGAQIDYGNIIKISDMQSSVADVGKLTASQLNSINHDATVLHSALRGFKGAIREPLVNNILATKR